jgi:RHS repeat-associated protein
MDSLGIGCQPRESLTRLLCTTFYGTGISAFTVRCGGIIVFKRVFLLPACLTGVSALLLSAIVSPALSGSAAAAEVSKSAFARAAGAKPAASPSTAGPHAKPHFASVKVTRPGAGQRAQAVAGGGAAAQEQGTITFSEFPDGTSITNQYQASGIIFGGDTPFITGDGANPTSPVLSGTPLYNGTVTGTFVQPDGRPRTVDAFSLDVGYIDSPGSTEVVAYDPHGTALVTEPIESTGIVNVSITAPGIASFAVESVDPSNPDPAGFAVDNVSFAGYWFWAGSATAAEQGGASNPSENPTTCSTPRPVNCATGVFWHQFTDLSVPGRGVALNLSRSYSSSDAPADGPFGYGWTDSYDMSLAVDQAGDVTISQEDGTPVTFLPDGSGGFTAPPRVLATLAKNADGSYTFTRARTQIRYNFSATGQLTGEVDLNGYNTALAYNSGGQLVTVADPAGRQLTFTYTGTHVTGVTDPMGRTWSYDYDSGGNLVTATDPMGRTWSFTYDANHLMLTMTDPRGGTTTNVYNSAAQVVSQTDPDGGTTTWGYTGDAASPGGGTTLITDPNGNVTQHQYANLELLSVTKGFGTPEAATTSYAYDPATLGVTSVTDPNGHTATSTYDPNGNQLSATDPLGDTTTYSYNNLNEVQFKTTPLGETTSYGYDASGNLLSVTDSLGNSTTYAYADTTHPGDVTSVTDPDGHAATYTYDTYGDVASVSRQPSASVTDITQYSYDTDGERTCEAPPNAVAKGVACPAAGTAVTVYDADGEITSVTDPDGHVTANAYDGDGNKTRVTDAAGHVTGYAYNGNNQRITVTRPDGTTETTGFDANGNPVKQLNASGATMAYVYDVLNQVVSTTDPLGHTTSYGYDLAGNRVRLTDAQGQVTSYTYDATNRLTGVTYSDGKTPDVSYTYDADGHRASMSDGTGTTTYTYDGAGRPTGVSNGAGAAVGYSYDAAGLLTALSYPNGDAVTRTYDGAGELATVADWLGHTTTFSYDHDGNVTSQAYPNGVSALSAYDAADQLTVITDKTSSATLAAFGYTRDNLGQLSSATETGAISDTQSYSYTQLSQLGAVNGAAYGYDPAGDLTKQPGGITQAFNANSQLTSATAPGTVKPAALDQAVSAGETSKSSLITSAALTAKAGDLVLAFVSAKGPSGKAQKITKLAGGGLTWALAARSDTQQGTAEIWQAHTAKVLSKVKITATLAYAGYNGTITLAAFTGARGAAGPHATASGATGAPAVKLTTTAADSLVWAVGEDPSHATAHTPAAGQAIVYQLGDTAGSDTFWSQRVTAAVAAAKTTVKIADTKPTTDRWNLAAVEILAAVPGTVSTAYAYNKDGDLTSITPQGKPATSLAYNQANELTGYGTGAAYAYDGDGLRMSKQVGATTTAFAWDQSGSLPLLIAAGTVYYVYGPGGVPIEQVDTTSNTVSYLLADQQGSTRLITNSAGAVTGSYTYGAYGAVTKHTGTATTALGYDAQYTDAQSGLQYLRARYYNPATGQFITLDPIVELTRLPYGYVGGNPVNFSDPSGQCPWCVGAIIGGITGAATGAVKCFESGTTGKECAASIIGGAIGGAVGGACVTSTLGASAAVCGAAGTLVGDLVEKYAFGQDISSEDMAVDIVFGAIGGKVGDRLFTEYGRLPTKLSNVLHPGVNATRDYLGGLVGGEIGLIPSLFKSTLVC